MLWPEKSQLNPTPDLHARTLHKDTPSTLRPIRTHNFLGADICNPICLVCCGYVLLVMKIAQSGREIIFFLTIYSFLPSRRCWCGWSAWSFIHQLFMGPACVDDKLLCHNDLKAERKELTLLKNEEAMIWQWNSMDSFKFVGQGAGNGSVSLLFLPVILSPLLQSCATLRGREFESAAFCK